jgi:pyruvate formate lyase activating enzyme
VALSRLGTDLLIDRNKCIQDWVCVGVCDRKALAVVGEQVTVDQVMAEVLKDKAFYDHSGGGVTISGGEPLYQFAFARELARACKRCGISAVLDTCGFASWAAFEQVLPYIDLVYFDLKHMDPREHRRLTGVDNSGILENCRRLSARGTPLVLRVPLVPGINDSSEHLKLLIEFVKGLPGDEQVHLLPYHRTGRVKYEMLGLEYLLAELQPPTKESVQRVVESLRQADLKVEVVC